MEYKPSQFQGRRSHNSQQPVPPYNSQPPLQRMIHHDQDPIQPPPSSRLIYTPGSDLSHMDTPRSRSGEYRNYSPMHNVSPTMPQFTPPAYHSTSPYVANNLTPSSYSPSAGNSLAPYTPHYGTTTPVQYSPNQPYYSQLNLSPLHPAVNQGGGGSYHPTQLGTSPVRPSFVNQFQSLNVDSSGRRASAAVLMPPMVPQNQAQVMGQLALPTPSFAKVRSQTDLFPRKNAQPQYRRANPDGGFMSPLQALTIHIPSTYRICNPQFKYESSRNPRRVLTKPSKGTKNGGYDNDDSDYILYVNDVLGGGKDQQKYLILDILGQGTFGQVVKCQNLKTQEVVAVKVIKNKPAYFNQSMMEVSVLDYINTSIDKNDEHHMLRLRDKFVHREHLCLVFELLSSNLYDLIKQNQFRGLSTNLVRVFAQQLLDALCVLKEAKLIHCDLKPENILLKNLESPAIKIIDFGSACHERQTVYTYVQSRFYRSPEVILGLPYSSSIDMWSLGCILAELFLGLPLFPGSSEYNQLSRIIEMLGMPPSWMIEMGKQAPEFFEKVTTEYGEKSYRLKSMDKYSREHKSNEQPSKRYFAATNFADIVRTYPMPKRNMKPAEIEKEMQNRESFIDFVSGLLNINPLERWTPEQARMHNFISSSKYSASNHGAHQSSDPSGHREESNDNAAFRPPQSQSYPYPQQQPNLGSLQASTQQQSHQQLQPSQHIDASSYYAPSQYSTNTVPSIAVTSNPYPPHQGMFAESTTGSGGLTPASSRSGRPRAVTMGLVDPIPPKLQRVGNLIDPTQAIRTQPSPAYFPPPEITDQISNKEQAPQARSRRRSNAQQFHHGDVIRNLEDGLSTSYWS